LTLLNMRKGDIANMSKDGASKIKQAGERLEELLNEIENISKNLCKEHKLCITVLISSGEKNPHTLRDEVGGILSAMGELEAWIQDIQADKDIGYDNFLSLAYMTVFGLPDEKDWLLGQILKELEEWYKELHDKVYTPLLSIQEKMGVFPRLQNLTEKVIEIPIRSRSELEEASHTLSDVLNEVKGIADRYEEIVKEINKIFADLRLNLNNVLKVLKESMDVIG